MGKNNPKNFDLIVLGSGPAGEKGAAQAAYFGKKVAIVEKNPFLGGAAASTTIPSKTLRETSLALSGLRARHLYGVDLSVKGHITGKELLHHERTVKGAERTRVMNNMQRHNVTVFTGFGSFVDRNTIKVESHNTHEILKADVILIATGSSPRCPENFPKDNRIFDSNSILYIKTIPKKMVIVGAGVIGCEYACIFAELGVDVNLINNKEHILTFLDFEISSSLEISLQKKGIKLFTNENVESCNLKPNSIEIKLESGKLIRTDTVMLAAGRSSNTQNLNLEAAGITTGKYGRLVVDKNYQVVHPETKKPVPGIFAAGDVIGPPALASTSMEQARFAMIQAFNLEPYKKHVAPILPLGIYTIPECALAGKTEQKCKDEKIDYVVGKAAYNENARGMIIGDKDGFLKLIFEFNKDLNKPMKLIGVHVIGEIASELIHIGVSALLSGADNNLFIDTCYNYPTLGELYKYATYDAMGKRNIMIKKEEK